MGSRYVAVVRRPEDIWRVMSEVRAAHLALMDYRQHSNEILFLTQEDVDISEISIPLKRLDIVWSKETLDDLNSRESTGREYLNHIEEYLQHGDCLLTPVVAIDFAAGVASLQNLILNSPNFDHSGTYHVSLVHPLPNGNQLDFIVLVNDGKQIKLNRKRINRVNIQNLEEILEGFTSGSIPISGAPSHPKVLQDIINLENSFVENRFHQLENLVKKFHGSRLSYKFERVAAEILTRDIDHQGVRMNIEWKHSRHTNQQEEDVLCLRNDGILFHISCKFYQTSTVEKHWNTGDKRDISLELIRLSRSAIPLPIPRERIRSMLLLPSEGFNKIREFESDINGVEIVHLGNLIETIENYVDEF